MANIENRKVKDIKPLDENGDRHGEWFLYHNNGKICYQSNYVRGSKHGLDQGYYSNGAIGYYGYFNFNREIGYWYWYGQKKYFLCVI